MEWVELAAARTASCAPVAAETGSMPNSSECCRAVTIAGDSTTKSSAYFQLSSLSATVAL
jgi:hypothetical protein